MATREITLKVKGEAELQQVTRQMEQLGQSYDKIRVQFQQGDKEATKGAKSVQRLGSEFNKLGAELGLAFGLGVVVNELKNFGVASVQAARESAAATAQLDAVLKSTGGTAGMTKDQLISMASAMQDITNFSDEAVLGGESLLLTFKNIGATVFPDATRAMLDMSQAMGQDLKSSAIQIGKALNDPVEGISALTRVGVTFTDAQKQMIESMVEAGNVAGAQKMILAELQSEFGGSAEAARQAAGGFQDVSVSFGEFQESVGRLTMAIGDTGLTGKLVELFDALGAGADAWQGNISQIKTISGLLDELASKNQAAAGAVDGLLSAALPTVTALKAMGKDTGTLLTVLNPFAGVLYETAEAMGIVGEAAPEASTQWVSSLNAMNIAVTETTGNLAKLAQVGNTTLAVTQTALDAQSARWQGMANLTRTGGATGQGQLETMAGGEVLTGEEAAALKEQTELQEKLSKQLAGTMASAFEDASNTIRSTIESVLKPSLDEVWQPPADEAHFDESARRLATVATSGFGSEWLAQLTQQFAGQDFFQPIVAAMQGGDEGALKEAATSILQNQVTKLWDVEQIKAQVRAQLQQDQLREQLINEIQQELGAEGMAVPIQATAAAATAVSEEVGVKLEEATGEFAGFKTAITEQKWPDVGADIVKGINQGIDKNLAAVKSKLRELAKEAIIAAQSELGISSPSQVFAQIGEEIIAGLSQGVGDFQSVLAQLLKLDTTQLGPGDIIGRAADDVEKQLDALGTIGEDKVKLILRGMKDALRANIGLIGTGTTEELRQVLQNAVANWEAAGLSGEQGKAVGVAVDAFAGSIMHLREEFAQLARDQQAANFQKMIGGIGQFAGQATGEADALSQKIAVLQTLLRQGAGEVMVGGETLNRSQAQARLGELMAEQSGSLGSLGRIQQWQQNLQDLQERSGLLNLLGGQGGPGSGAVIEGLANLTDFLGRQLVRGGGAGGDTTIRNYYFNNTINSGQAEGSILRDLFELAQTVPSGT